MYTISSDTISIFSSETFTAMMAGYICAFFCTYESKYITTAGPMPREKRTNIHYLPTLKRLVLAMDDFGCELQPLSSLGSETDASQVTRGFGKNLVGMAAGLC